ncbi:MAG: hypothetical protein ACPGRU_02100, partial [Candidatus Puniceispirillaceae bacterium]
QFDTEVGLLREVNNIRGNLIRAGDTMMIPEGSAWANSLAMALPLLASSCGRPNPVTAATFPAREKGGVLFI